MRRLLALVLLMGSVSCRAMEALPALLMDEQLSYRIEVLQVTDIAPYQESFDGFMKTLQDNGIVPGANVASSPPLLRKRRTASVSARTPVPSARA